MIICLVINLGLLTSAIHKDDKNMLINMPTLILIEQGNPSYLILVKYKHHQIKGKWGEQNH